MEGDYTLAIKNLPGSVPPDRFHSVDFADPEHKLVGPEWKFATGLHLVTAPTKVGKTTFCAGLVAGLAQFYPSTVAFYYMFEANATAIKAVKSTGSASGSEKSSKIFRKARDFQTDLALFFRGVNANPLQKQEDGGLVVFDSLSLPMRSFQLVERADEPAIVQSMQPSDIEFCVWLGKWLSDRKLVGLGIVNSDLVPFIDKLDAQATGIVTVTAYNRASRHDRGSARKKLNMTLPKSWTKLAEDAGFIPPYDVGSKLASSFSGVET